MTKNIKRNRAKLLFDNVVIYGLGGSISKLIHFFMLPFVVRMLPDVSYYGYYDIVTVMISFGEAIGIMAMCDTMYRYFFEQESIDYRKEICSTSLIITITSTIVTCMLIIIFFRRISRVFFCDIDESRNLIILVILAIICSSLSKVILTPIKMENKRYVYLSINSFTAICLYTIAVILLKRKIYIYALPIATLISLFIQLIIYFVINNRWFSIKYINFKYMKSMLLFALPLVPNLILYWIFNSCDRMMITNMLGIEAEGVYAAGAKIGQASQLIYSAFAGGWQYFAFSTMKDEDQVTIISKILEYAGIIAFTASMLACLLCKVVFNLFFTKQYTGGDVVVPYLFSAPLILMLFQIAGSQLLIVKKTWMNLIILFSGAAINILCNWIFIKIIGIEGAAIGTLLGYVFIVFFIILLLKKMELLYIDKRLIISSLIYVVNFMIWRISFDINTGVSILCTIISFVIYIRLYIEEIKYLISILRKKGEKNI